MSRNRGVCRVLRSALGLAQVSEVVSEYGQLSHSRK